MPSARLLIGPLLRRVVGMRATVWVETSAPAVVTAAAATRALARSAGVRRPFVRWKKLAGPYFGNAIATLTHRGRAAEVVIEGTTDDGRLRTVARQRLSDEP